MLYYTFIYLFIFKSTIYYTECNSKLWYLCYNYIYRDWNYMKKREKDENENKIKPKDYKKTKKY